MTSGKKGRPWKTALRKKIRARTQEKEERVHTHEARGVVDVGADLLVDGDGAAHGDHADLATSQRVLQTVALRAKRVAN